MRISRPAGQLRRRQYENMQGQVYANEKTTSIVECPIGHLILCRRATVNEPSLRSHLHLITPRERAHHQPVSLNVPKSNLRQGSGWGRRRQRSQQQPPPGRAISLTCPIPASRWASPFPSTAFRGCLGRSTAPSPGGTKCLITPILAAIVARLPENKFWIPRLPRHKHVAALCPLRRGRGGPLSRGFPVCTDNQRKNCFAVNAFGG
jgi:hypothetical protein